MKKLAFYGDSLVYQYAGIRNYNWDLLVSLSKAFDTTVLLPSQLEQNLIDAETKILPETSFLHKGRFRAFGTIPKFVNNESFEIAIEPAHFGPFRLKPSITRVTVIHDLTPINFPSFHPLTSVFAHKLLLKSVLAGSDYIIVNSQTTKNELIEYESSSQEKIIVFYPNIPISRERGSFNEANNQDLYFVSIGTLEPRKNYAFFLSVFRELRKKRPNVKWIILGKAGWKIKPELFINEEGVEWKGFVTNAEKEEYLNRAMAYVSTSHYEGFGLPTLEAMAHGLPMFLSDINAHREVTLGSVDLLKLDKATWLDALSRFLKNRGKETHYHTTLAELQEERKSQYQELVKKLKN